MRDRNEVLSRQSFLGARSSEQFAAVRVGLIGLGGGGSHIAQQLVHLGVEHFVVFDGDRVESSNLNRLVGATCKDALRGMRKVEVAARYIRNVNPNARVEKHVSRWQDAGAAIRSVDVIFGCVDSYSERQQLEVVARRYAIPYIDIGMDVTRADGRYAVSGQVILSLPGGPCMWCLGFLTREKLSHEAERYGAAGGRPQVVWSNGVLASTAVGLFVDVVTGWSRATRKVEYLVYDGNRNTFRPHVRLDYAPEVCSHFSPLSVGDPVFK